MHVICATKSTTTLKTHMNKVHEDSKEIKCDFCQKTFR